MENEVLGIKVRNLSKRLGKTQVLKGLSLDFAPGLMHGVVGPDGVGKTTLFRCLVALLHPDEGEILYLVDGRAVSLREIKSRISYMPQQQSLYADLSVSEHLDFFRALFAIPEPEYRRRREDLLEITQLKEFVDRPAGALSGGMYKKLGLMCALLRSPRALLLDEPTTGVDPLSRREFWDLLYQLSEQKVLILVATSAMDEADRCEKVHRLERSKA